MTSPMPHEEHNARRFIWSNGLQNIGDQIVAPKTVLAWMFTVAGVPAVFTSFLVPIRESGSMLPQFALSPWVTSHASRKKVWLIGSWGQAISAALIAVSALLFSGKLLGITTLILVGALALFRAVCSIAGKDVQGRTISKGRRGVITGRATALGGGFTLAVGLILFFLPNDLPEWGIVALLALGASTWAFASIVFSSIKEPEAEVEESTDDHGFKQMWELVKGDRVLQNFLIVRSLLLATALSTPFIVVLAHREGANLAGLGAFIVASGGAALVGGRVSGMWSDRSSKTTMSRAAAVASVVILLLVASAQFAPAAVNAWVMPLGFFLVNLAHTTVRVARKTYLVDMTEGDRRTLITGVSNTVMGIVLLIVGAISSAIAAFGPQAALLFLAAMGFAGVIGAARLKDVSDPGV
ncbi:MFS transporter [Corynebacterium sp. MSK041]|uniref:MFS transporter n=1 Tax=Corynebacterium sp. MSK041 TaxID=3050194 RepID=UPI00254B1573|nr:MFS transporter [Corynebacterium sp. MSK041]MDK8795146.1 MFS transporter [Corynebacterium sp. MSK041]